MMNFSIFVPSGKQPHNYGKSPCYSWVNPLFQWAIFDSKLLVYQRVYPINIPLNHYKVPLNHYFQRGRSTTNQLCELPKGSHRRLESSLGIMLRNPALDKLQDLVFFWLRNTPFLPIKRCDCCWLADVLLWKFSTSTIFGWYLRPET